MNRMEWDSIRIFLAVVEAGSMSAAAQVLGMSQPTVSRQVLALEEKVGFNLFDRSCTGLTLTSMGEGLLETARQTASGAEAFLRQVNACTLSQEGHVRLAVSEMAGFYFLPKALKAFHQQYPSIEVEILVDNQGVNLNKREADLLISLHKSEQPDMVVSHLHQEPLGFFAHREYLLEAGIPNSLRELHDNEFNLIGYDQLDYYQKSAKVIGYTVTKSQFSFRTDSHKMQIELARAKAGIAVVFKSVAKQYPELVSVLPNASIPDVQWWLVSHRDVHINPRIRYLMEFLSKWFKNNTT
ncbi:LysR family transcriptional regulator [Photobacterium minamisatsumaniensis]|uniref:LysR family transcriptional regulator n=1 Tax=Photobacterium minamisatsumaniensis TaxID=2910233 RepID=UPI003D09E846